MKMKLFRGISLNEKDVERVTNDIRMNGINISPDASWGGIQYHNIRDKINELFLKPDLTCNDTMPEINQPNSYTHGELVDPVHAIEFADKIGAEYFALLHNKTESRNVSILIEVEDDINNVIISGRDFLFPCFQFIEQDNVIKQKGQIEIIVSLFGDSIKKYLLKAAFSNNLDYRMALCHLAVQDQLVIADFYKNNKLIQGRHGTKFKSYFAANLPITPEKIINIKRLDDSTFTAKTDISLADIIN